MPDRIAGASLSQDFSHKPLLDPTDVQDGSDVTGTGWDTGIVLGSTAEVYNELVADLGATYGIESMRLRALNSDLGTLAGIVTFYSGASASGPWTERDSVVPAAADIVGSWAPVAARYWRVRWSMTLEYFVYFGGPLFYTWDSTDGDVDASAPTDPGYEDPGPAPAILEIFVHDEDASRWDTATWADGPATGTEGVWSDAAWTDVTPQGVTAHVRWGSTRAERGILAELEPGAWNVVTYDPDRKLDPGNPDSPYAPQLTAGLPLRISTGATVIRTGVVTSMEYSYREPDYRGQILATDTPAILAQSNVPAGTVLGDTLRERVEDAIAAAGLAYGGIAIYPGRIGLPGGPNGPSLAAWPGEEASVWEIVRAAAQERGWMVGVDRHGALYFRPWAAPSDRYLTISAPMLTDLLSYASEDGMVSVVQARNALDTDTVEVEATPLPRYGRRVFVRSWPTYDPAEFAAAILADRTWPGVRWRPGTIRPRTQADNDELARVALHERVRLSVPGVVTVAGVVAGGELWASHRRGAAGPTWRWRFQVATSGSSVIGTTTLVADGTGDTLTDDATGTDYLTPDA